MLSSFSAWRLVKSATKIINSIIYIALIVQVHNPSDEDELPLGVEAINEDVFDLDELEEEEELGLEQVVKKSPAASVASSTFYSAVREVSKNFIKLD